MSVQSITPQSGDVAINSSNLYIDLNKQGKGSLSNAKSVDKNLVSNKVERLLSFKEEMTRRVNVASESTLFSAGQINAAPVEFKVLRTQLSPYIQEAFFKATCIPYITVYRVDIISGKYTITETIKYTNCYILDIMTAVQSDPDVSRGRTDTALDNLYFSIRYEKREDTVAYHNQEGKAIGQKKTEIDFKTGQLAS